MPRLIGKKNNSALYAGFAFLIALVGAIALEYFGVINYIPNFGKETKANNTSTNQPVQIKK
ncbi:MAG: hypothetical protein VKL41_04365 [Snowella sp.]|jgi:hypothetical protein|nr:hypothetical protein [Snowella sp.]PZV25020.1 MAG: hypothetical protein DCF12_16430 [Snowella sp.]